MQGSPSPRSLSIQEGVSSSTLAQPPLVGRGAEIDQLATRLSHAARRQGGALFLVGEAGIGKTWRMRRSLWRVNRASSFWRAALMRSKVAWLTLPSLQPSGPFCAASTLLARHG